jgi:hypothetical protein
VVIVSVLHTAAIGAAQPSTAGPALAAAAERDRRRQPNGACSRGEVEAILRA